jgi:hypothetical protein
VVEHVLQGESIAGLALQQLKLNDQNIEEQPSPIPL